jgi:hypothetical protein
MAVYNNGARLGQDSYEAVKDGEVVGIYDIDRDCAVAHTESFLNALEGVCGWWVKLTWPTWEA